MRLFRNLYIVFLFLAFLIGPALLFLAQSHSPSSLPSWLTAEDARYLEGNDQRARLADSATITAVSNGSFQSAFDETINGYIPARASAILGNAAWQRGSIQLSNALFQWNCYPTWYGSSYVYIPSDNALEAQACKQTNFDSTGFTQFLDTVSRAAKENPGIEFVVYMTNANTDTCSLNLTRTLTSDAFSYHSLVEQMESTEATTKLPNLALLNGGRGGDADISNYFQDYYACDEHWTIKGTMLAYRQICDSLDVPVVVPSIYHPLIDQQFNGNIARRALYRLPVDIQVLDYDFSSLHGKKDDGTEVNLEDHNEYQDASYAKRFYDFYSTYYSDTNLGIAIHGGKGDRKILLVGDSFATTLAYPLAESSDTLYRSIALYGSIKQNTDFTEHLALRDIDTVVFVGMPKNLSTFMKRNPHFFD